MAAGGVLSAAIAVGLGYPCFRLRGHYFTIATIVIAETGYLLFLNWDWVGAALGIQIRIRADDWLKFQFARSKIPYFYFVLGLASATWLATFVIEGSKWGYWWRAVKDNPEAAESLGVEVFHSKMAAAAACRKARSARRNPVGRRAADACDRPVIDDAAPPADARRAVPGHHAEA